MRSLKSMMVLLAMPAVLFLSSCSKDNQVNPSSSNVSSNLTSDDALLPGEFVQGTVSPGIYAITKFTDTGDDKTAQFAGYTFEFTADGAFIATAPNGNVFNGSYNLKNNSTMMNLSISGNKALKDLDDDSWNVVKLTNMKIKLKKNGPDVVVFQKI